MLSVSSAYPTQLRYQIFSAKSIRINIIGGPGSSLLVSVRAGYGASGAGGVIPPNADLIFEVR